MTWQWVLAICAGITVVGGAAVFVGRKVRDGVRIVAAATRLIEAELRTNHGSSLVDQVRLTHGKVAAMEPAVASNTAAVAELRGELSGMKTSLDANYDRLDSYRDQVMGFREDRTSLNSRMDAQIERIEKLKDWAIDTVNPRLEALAHGQDLLGQRVADVEHGLASRVVEAHVEIVKAVTASSPPTPAGGE